MALVVLREYTHLKRDGNEDAVQCPEEPAIAQGEKTSIATATNFSLDQRTEYVLLETDTAIRWDIRDADATGAGYLPAGGQLFFGVKRKAGNVVSVKAA